MSLKESINAIATALIAACAVVVTGILIRDRLSDPRQARPPIATIRPIPGWDQVSTGGLRVGPTEAAVTIVEFSDFQCPFCASAHVMLAELLRRHPNEVALIYRHYPLAQIHPYARAAAIAAECAGAVGRFPQMHNALFEQQASIGVRPWDAFATDAGVGDLDAFNACIESIPAANRVDADLAAGNRLAIAGTPTLLVNGFLIEGPISLQRLDELVADALENRLGGLSQ